MKGKATQGVASFEDFLNATIEAELTAAVNLPTESALERLFATLNAVENLHGRVAWIVLRTLSEVARMAVAEEGNDMTMDRAKMDLKNFHDAVTTDFTANLLSNLETVIAEGECIDFLGLTESPGETVH